MGKGGRVLKVLKLSRGDSRIAPDSQKGVFRAC